MKKENRGGRRVNQTGRPKKDDPYQTMTFRISASDKAKAQQRYGKDLNEMFRQWIKGLI